MLVSAITSTSCFRMEVIRPAPWVLGWAACRVLRIAFWQEG